MNPKAPGADCANCPLQEQPFVPSDGPEKASIVLCGEAPGANEVGAGRPFVGKSGQLLNKVLQFNQIDRAEVFVTNSVLCRPPSNRTPTKKEREACSGRLRAEIQAREPEVIITVGNAAAQAFLGGTEGVTSLRVGGRRPLPGWDCDIVPTFHPAYALRNPGALPTIVSDVGRATRIEVGWEPTRYKVAASTEQAIEMLGKQAKFPTLAADIEVTHFPGCCDDHPKRGTDPHRFDWLCFGVSHEPGASVVYPREVISDPRFQAVLAEHMRDADTRWVWQNGQFDIQRLWTFAPHARVDEDTMLAHFVTDERVGTHDLGQLATEFLRAPNYKDEEKKHLPSKGASLEHLPTDVLHRYNATDCDVTHRLLDIMAKRIADEGVERPYRDLLIPGANVLASVERRGITMDFGQLDVLWKQHHEREQELESALTKWVANPRSPKQVDAALQELGVALPDTRADTLTAARLTGEAGKFVKALIEYRQVSKYRSTYIDGFLARATPDGRIHPNFKLANTETGRLACADPNVQNIPRAKAKRDVFIAREGHTLVAADYSNIEYVFAGILSGDPFICQAFIDGRNLHDELAREFLGDSYLGKDGGDKGKEQYTQFKCFHPDTEVLTRSGWKKILDLTEGEDVIQAVPEGQTVRLEWARPLEVFSAHHPSKQLVHLSNEGIDLRVTPDHRMLAWKSPNAEGVVVMPEQLGKARFWMNAGTLRGGSDEREALLRLAVATQADGSVTKQGRVQFGFTKKRKVVRMRDLLESSNLPFVERGEDRAGVYWFYIKSKDSEPLLRLLDGKSLSWSMLSLSESSRLVVVDEARFWDAHQNDRWTQYVYCNTDEQSIDVLQAIATSVGRKTYKRRREGLFVLSVKDHAHTRGGNLSSAREDFTNEVACLSVPSTFVLVRSGGIPVVTGQTFNFGLAYGESVGHLAKRSGLPFRRAQEMAKFFWRRVPRYKRYQQELARQMLNQGWVESMFGRKRRFPLVTAENRYDLLKEAYNFPLQSSASDLTLQALIRLAPLVAPYDAHPIITVHDQLVFEVPDEAVPDVARLVKETMEDTNLPIPTRADVEIGRGWGSLEAFR